MIRTMIVLVCNLVAGMVLAQTPGLPEPRDEFYRLDSDEDGSLTQSEATAASSSFMFTDADTNRDGKISRNEYLVSIRNKPLLGKEPEYEKDPPLNAR